MAWSDAARRAAIEARRRKKASPIPGVSRNKVASHLRKARSDLRSYRDSNPKSGFHRSTQQQMNVQYRAHMTRGMDLSTKQRKAAVKYMITKRYKLDKPHGLE